MIQFFIANKIKKISLFINQNFISYNFGLITQKKKISINFLN